MTRGEVDQCGLGAQIGCQFEQSNTELLPGARSMRRSYPVPYGMARKAVLEPHDVGVLVSCAQKQDQNQPLVDRPGRAW